MSLKAQRILAAFLQAQTPEELQTTTQELSAYIEELERKAQAWDKCQDEHEALVRVAALLSRKHN